MLDEYRTDPAGTESNRLEQGAVEFLHQFNLLMKLAMVHEPTNEALLKPVRLLSGVIGRLLREEPDWYFKIIHDQLFISQQRLRIDAETYPNYIGLVDAMKKRGIGFIAFLRVPDENEIVKFIYLFNSYRLGDDMDGLQGLFDKNEMDFIRVAPLQSASLNLPLKSRARAACREAFFGSIFMTKSVLQAVEHKKTINLRRSRRVVQSLIDILGIDEDYLVGLTSMKNYDDYTFNHSINVTILALNMGRYLKLSPSQLTNLGLSAVFHDLGKVSMPQNLLNKTSRLNDNEWQTMHRHPIEGVKKLLRIKGIGEGAMRLVVSVYEHHRNYDYTGYPELPLSAEATLYSRILRIVDSYDAMTSRRIYSQVPKHPVAALEEIWNLAGKNFDPILVKVFFQMMGRYPVGTVVQMENGAIGMVVSMSRSNPENPQPVIEVLDDWNNKIKAGQLYGVKSASCPGIVGYYDFGLSPTDPSWYLFTMEERPVNEEHRRNDE